MAAVPLPLQARREPLGPHQPRITRHLALLQRPTDRVSLAGRGISCCFRFHAALCHRDEKRKRHSRQSSAGHIVPGTGMGYRRRARHGGKLLHVPVDRTAVLLHLVAALQQQDGHMIATQSRQGSPERRGPRSPPKDTVAHRQSPSAPPPRTDRESGAIPPPVPGCAGVQMREPPPQGRPRVFWLRQPEVCGRA